MQCLLVFLGSICGFGVVIVLLIYGTNNALWAFVGVILSLHNRATSLCCNIVCIIPIVAIFK
jgi:hypothetical protein